MNITHLREFIEIAHCLSYSRAAENLSVTQSALSKHVLALERECGASLFDRSSSHVQLTSEGQVLFEEAIMLVDRHDSALERIQSLRSLPTVSVAGLYKNPIVLKMLGDAQEQLEERGEPIIVSYQDYRHRPYIELVEDGSTDLAITLLSEDDELPGGLTGTLLFTDPLIAMAKRDHPFASRSTVSFRELDEQPVLKPVGSYSSAPGVSTVKALCARYGIQPIEKPIFVQSIHDLGAVPNKDNLLIMERSLTATQPFSEDYVPVTFEEDDVYFRFYAVRRQANDNPGLRLLIEQLEAQGA